MTKATISDSSKPAGEKKKMQQSQKPQQQQGSEKNKKKPASSSISSSKAKADIDDIFAAKGKPSQAPSVASKIDSSSNTGNTSAKAAKTKKQGTQLSSSSSSSTAQNSAKPIDPTQTQQIEKAKVSEIDDIFGSKGKRKAETDVVPTTSESTTSKPTNTESKKKVKTNSSSNSSNSKHMADNIASVPVVSSASQRKPVETVDFSAKDPGSKPQPPPPKLKPGEEVDTFADSRGTLSTSRVTEDGLRVFYTDELKVGDGEAEGI
ncbi:hypothetical protein HDU76_005260 [Blyttiomyces sp. JEL0837]|nr:hypothetical protein HDU76_005260 [Blyttiomyces sp. JEL0837]